MRITIYNEEEVLLEDELHSDAYYEGVFVSLAIKYDILSLGNEYFENTMAAFELRSKLKLTPYQKNDVYNRSSLEIQKLLRYIGNYNLELNINEYREYISTISMYDYGNLEDVKSFFEEHKKLIKNATKISIIR